MLETRYKKYGLPSLTLVWEKGQVEGFSRLFHPFLPLHLLQRRFQRLAMSMPLLSPVTRLKRTR